MELEALRICKRTTAGWPTGKRLMRQPRIITTFTATMTVAGELIHTTYLTQASQEQSQKLQCSLTLDGNQSLVHLHRKCLRELQSEWAAVQLNTAPHHLIFQQAGQHTLQNTQQRLAIWGAEA